MVKGGWKGEKEEDKRGGRRRRKKRRERAKRSGEEETVLPLMTSLSSRGDRLLAPKIQAQLKSQLDLNLYKWQGFPSLQEYPLGCWQGWGGSCQVPGGSGAAGLECALVQDRAGGRLFFPANLPVQWDFHSEISAKGKIAESQNYA